MSKLNHKKNISYRDWLIRTAIIIFSVSSIVYFLPRQGKFGYYFELDKPWRYGQLIATFDFPIYKTQDAINAERDSLMKQYQPDRKSVV